MDKGHKATGSSDGWGDWEHIDDDAFSVRSLSASDDELLNPSPPSDSRPSSPTVDASSDTLRDLVSSPQKPQPQPAHSNDVDHDEKSGDTLTDHTLDLTDHADPTCTETGKGKLKEVLDMKIRPVVLFDQANSVEGQLLQMATELGQKCDKRQCFDEDYFSHLLSLSWVLHDNVVELKSILHSYAEYCKSQESCIPLPIDPSLYSWLTGLRNELVNLGKSISATVPVKSSHMERHRESLENYHTQIQMFLPMMQIDLTVFYTAGLHLVERSNRVAAATISGDASETRQGRGRGHLPPGNSMSHLRREVYNLKDSICSCLEEANACLKLGIANSNDKTVLEAFSLSYGDIKKSLELMLSNHASDWIEYSTAGGLTYPDFCRLNPDTSRSLSLQLHEVKDDLFLEAQKARQHRYLNDPDDHITNEGVTIRESTLDILGSVEEILLSLFRLRRNL